jgi:hypothetical protein
VPSTKRCLISAFSFTTSLCPGLRLALRKTSYYHNAMATLCPVPQRLKSASVYGHVSLFPSRGPGAPFPPIHTRITHGGPGLGRGCRTGARGATTLVHIPPWMTSDLIERAKYIFQALLVTGDRLAEVSGGVHCALLDRRDPETAPVGGPRHRIWPCLAYGDVRYL